MSAESVGSSTRFWLYASKQSVHRSREGGAQWTKCIDDNFAFYLLFFKNMQISVYGDAPTFQLDLKHQQKVANHTFHWCLPPENRCQTCS